MLRSAIALVALGGLAGSAMAGITETLSFGGAIFPMHASGTGVDDPLFQSKVLTGTSGTPIIGFTVTFDYDESVADASWASDAAMRVDFVGDMFVNLAGTFGGMGRLGGTPDAIWSFDGSGSNLPGTYSTTYFFGGSILTPDSVEISLTDTFNGGNSFTNITIDLIMVPTPGAAALLGLAGIAGIRRRR
jgi:hypothetical protein